MNLTLKISAYLYAFAVMGFTIPIISLFFAKDKHPIFYEIMKIILVTGTSLFIAATIILMIDFLHNLN